MGKLKESATLYFLMKTSFNGWWKVYNYSRGRYSTPPGTVHQKEEFIDKELLRDTAEFLRERVTLMCGDFENVQRYADIETVGNTYFYFDPPYRDSSTKYTAEGFDDKDQIRLCELMQYCDMKGGMVSMSNKEIGDGFWYDHVGNMDILEYDAKYTAGRGTTTNDVKEVFIRNFEISQGPLSTLFV
jgi:DNA adenine methylase